MAEKDYLKPIVKSLEKFVPTSRALLNFVNSKSRGVGLGLSFFKVQFLNKSEKSTYTCMQVELMEFEKQLHEFKLTEKECEELVHQAEEMLAEARKDVERVYGEVRRYIVSSELRKNCIDTHYRKIPGLHAKQNEAVAKEIFTLAYEENLKNEEHEIEDITDLFCQINRYALSLFQVAEESK